MQVVGERQVPAPRERVWTSLRDPGLIGESLGGGRVERRPDGVLVIEGLAATPVRVTETASVPGESASFEVQHPNLRAGGAGAGREAAPTPTRLSLRLAEQRAFTLLSYVIDLPADTAEPQIRAVRERIDAALGRFVAAIAGPAEIAAGGLSNAIQAATEPSAQPNARLTPPPGLGAHLASEAVPAGAAWMGAFLNAPVIGGVLFLIVLLFLIGVL